MLMTEWTYIEQIITLLTNYIQTNQLRHMDPQQPLKQQPKPQTQPQSQPSPSSKSQPITEPPHQNPQPQTQPSDKKQPPNPEPLPQKQSEQAQIDDLINQFQQGNLNLTNQQQKEQPEDAEIMEQIKKQYEKFMKDMQTDGDNAAGDDGLGVGDLGQAFQNLLSGLNQGGEGGNHVGQKFQQMFKSLEDPGNFQKAAADLLNQFMDKSLLQQPLTETKQNYQKYMKSIEQKGQTVQPKYIEQYKIVQQLLDVVQKTPENKPKMIQLFSKLQEKGNPPQGIAPGFSMF